MMQARSNIVMMDPLISFVRGLFVVLWAELVSRTTGPLALRFLLQPMVACTLAMCDGIKDGRANRTPCLTAILTEPHHRRDRLLEGLTAVSRVFILAVIVDLIYQYLVLNAFRPIQTLIIGFFLAFLPYLMMRGPAARITQQMLQTPGATTK